MRKLLTSFKSNGEHQIHGNKLGTGGWDFKVILNLTANMPKTKNRRLGFVKLLSSI